MIHGGPQEAWGDNWDYRWNLEMFTALQLNGKDSKLILFLDEGNWILNPQNSEFWYGNVLDWLGKYLKT